MKTRDFCYWLQGLYELSCPTTLNEKQTDLIRKHLNMVFIHDIDPTMPDPDGKLEEAHTGKPSFHLHGDPLARC